MARTPSNMVNLGTLAPSFKLLNTINNETVISDNYFNKKDIIKKRKLRRMPQL